MKKIIWIDDNKDKMRFMVNILFPVLWADNIFNHIIFTGDDYKGEGVKKTLTQLDIERFTNDMYDKFDSFCRKEAFRRNAEQSGDQTQKKWDTAKIFREKEEILPVMPDLITTTDRKAAMEQILLNISKKNDKELYIGLDIRLFLNDEEIKLKEKEEDENPEDATVTMELYNELSESKYNYHVFLYSSFSLEDDVRLIWRKKLARIYKGKYNPDTIQIYSRQNLLNLNDTNKDWQEFSAFLKLSTGKGKSKVEG